MRGRRYLLVPLVLLSVSSLLSRQEDDRKSDHSSHQTLALSVDGAKAPAEIPEEMAYGLFFRALASSRNSSVVQGVLRKAGLDGADIAAAESALRSLTSAMDSVQDQKQSKPLAELQSFERTALQATRQEMLAKLSDTGRAKLETYVATYVKQRTRIYTGTLAETQR